MNKILYFDRIVKANTWDSRVLRNAACLTCILTNVKRNEVFSRAKRNRDKRVIRVHGYFLIPCLLCLSLRFVWHTHVRDIWRIAYVKRRRDEESFATGFRIGRLAGHKTWPRFKRITFSLSLFLVSLACVCMFLLLFSFPFLTPSFLPCLATPSCSTIAWLCILCIELWFMRTTLVNKQREREKEKNMYINCIILIEIKISRDFRNTLMFLYFNIFEIRYDYFLLNILYFKSYGIRRLCR